MRQRIEDSVECGLVEIASQRNCDIAYGCVGGEIVFRSYRLDFFCHRCTVFKLALGLVEIPVGHEKRTRPDWQYTQEANRFLSIKTATNRAAEWMPVTAVRILIGVFFCISGGTKLLVPKQFSMMEHTLDQSHTRFRTPMRSSCR